MSKHIHIGIEAPGHGLERFINAWEQAEQGQVKKAEVHLNFENLSMLLSIVTPKRLEIMKTLRQQGAMSIRALSKYLHRDYKNVHVDISSLQQVGLVEKTKSGTIKAPWDVIDAHLRLVA